jgi:prepilin-type N-terminal cleavage/methylation domain-containing protein
MDRRGFTALELVLTMTVAGIVMALAAPRFVAFRDGAAVHAATNELGSLFSTARHSAMARRTAVGIVFGGVGAVELHAAGEVLTARPLGRLYGVTVVANRDSAVYDARGLAYGVSNLTVVVRRGAIVDTLTMSRLGRVRF